MKIESKNYIDFLQSLTDKEAISELNEVVQNIKTRDTNKVDSRLLVFVIVMTLLGVISSLIGFKLAGL